ncbi:MAG TPA: methionyl-tRNA formyltransferase, partial [Brevundimonas sp.]
DGTRVKVLMSRAEPTHTGAPGQILDEDLLVACGAGAVRLIRVQREGKAVQTAADLLKGFPLPAGTLLG